MIGNKHYDEAFERADERFKAYLRDGSISEFRTFHSFLVEEICSQFDKLESRIPSYGF